MSPCPAILEQSTHPILFDAGAGSANKQRLVQNGAKIGINQNVKPTDFNRFGIISLSGCPSLADSQLLSSWLSWGPEANQQSARLLRPSEREHATGIFPTWLKHLKHGIAPFGCHLGHKVNPFRGSIIIQNGEFFSISTASSSSSEPTALAKNLDKNTPIGSCHVSWNKTEHLVRKQRHSLKYMCI